MSGEGDVGAWWQAMVDATPNRDEAVHDAYQYLQNTGLINKVTVHRYVCRKAGCVLATVVRLGDTVLARTRDYKLSPGLNLNQTVESARVKNTLDGNRHWPGHTFDVTELATWGESAGMPMNCRHVVNTTRFVDVLAAATDVRPGHPGAPTLL